MLRTTEIWSSESGDVTFDFHQQTITLRDQGSLSFEGSARPDNKGRPARVVVQNLRIIDDRTEKTTPAIRFTRLNNSQIRDVSVNRAEIACRIEHCWDFEIDSCVFIHGTAGLQVTSNTNGLTVDDCTIEKMTGLSIAAENSRNLVFTRTCKIHGIPPDPEGRTVARFVDCGSVMFEARLMHCVPHVMDGLILFNGQKTESIVCNPWILRTGEGSAVIFRDVPHDLLRSESAIEMRRQSLVDPKPKLK